MIDPERIAENQQHRDMGLMEGRMRALEREVTDMKQMVQVVHDTMMQAKGSWRLMLIVGGAAATASAIITQFFSSFHR